MLPPQRELADYLDVNLSTITRAFKLCTQKGLIVSSTGNGTYVSSDVVYQSNMLLCGTPEDKAIEMGPILPAVSPNRYVVSALESLLKEPNAEKLLQYSSNQYNTRQRMMGAKWLAKSGIDINYQHILLASGGQNALTAILSGFFQPGDKLGCDIFTYPGLKSAAKLLGIVLVPISDYSKNSLEAIHKQYHLKGIYLIADYCNPTTDTLRISVRKTIAAFIQKHDILLLEDGINALLSKELTPPLYSYAPNHTIYFSSLSKTIAPGLRIAYMVAPERYEDTLAGALYNMNVSVSSLLAQTAATLIQSGTADKILTERKVLTKKRNQLVNMYLKDYKVHGDDYCSFRWLILPKGYKSHDFELLAKASSLHVFAADRFLVGSTLPFEAVRISIVSEEDDKNFELGLLKLKDLLEHLTYQKENPEFL